MVKQMKRGPKKLIFWLFFPAVFILIVTGAGITLWIYNLLQEIPDEKVIREFRENKNQIWVPISNMSKILQDAIIASEDPYFFKHGGIDYRQTWESIKTNIRVWSLVRGGSTITQQVAKNVFLSKEKTLTRKIKEYFLAKRIEATLPKERIMELYLNEVGWGYGIYGAELASIFYLNKHAGELNIAEAAFLTAMLRNPAYYNPYKRGSSVIKRQHLVLMLMLRHNLITKEEYNEALSYPVELRQNKKERRFTNIIKDP